jgi:hypothetical protein
MRRHQSHVSRQTAEATFESELCVPLAQRLALVGEPAFLTREPFNRRERRVERRAYRIELTLQLGRMPVAFLGLLKLDEQLTQLLA